MVRMQTNQEMKRKTPSRTQYIHPVSIAVFVLATLVTWVGAIALEMTGLSPNEGTVHRERQSQLPPTA